MPCFQPGRRDGGLAVGDSAVVGGNDAMAQNPERQFVPGGSSKSANSSLQKTPPLRATVCRSGLHRLADGSGPGGGQGLVEEHGQFAAAECSGGRAISAPAATRSISIRPSVSQTVALGNLRPNRPIEPRPLPEPWALRRRSDFPGTNPSSAATRQTGGRSNCSERRRRR
jgi:hypothetical protein